MVDDSTSDDIATTNKGVNVHSESLPARIHRYNESETSSSTNRSARSITVIRNEIQTVLDMMGPSTATSICCNTSSEADNEASQHSVQQSSSRSKRTHETSRSSQIVSSSNKDSVVAGMGTCSANDCYCCEDEYSCCEHNHLILGSEGTCVNPPSRTVCYSTPKTTKLPACKKRSLIEWLKEKSSELKLKKQSSVPCELYKINICGQMDEIMAPKRVVFDLVEGIPKPTSSSVATNTIRNPIEKCKTNPQSPARRNEPLTSNVQRNIFYDSDGNTRVDFYYFDHGNAQYFHTTDTPPVLKSEIIAEKTERYTTRFWAEFFASIHIFVSFCVSFILQLFKFLLYSIIRPLCIGVLQLASDYFLKPFLTTFFNGVVQPSLIFLYNVATSARDLCDPIAEAFGYFCREVAVVLRAIRLCTYRNSAKEDCSCDKKNKCEC